MNVGSPLPHRSTPQIVGESIVFFTIALIAFFGNFLVCVALYKNPRLRTTTSQYIMALALSDILNSVLVQTMTVGTLISGQWITGSVGCMTQGFFNLYLSYVSLHTMTLTALNRFFCLGSQTQLSKRVFSHPVLLISTVWAYTAAVVLIPHLAKVGQFMFFPDNAVCAPVFPNEAAYVSFECFFYSGLPMAITAFCYFKVSKAIHQHNVNVAQSLSNQDGKRSSATLTVDEIVITRTLFALVAAFFLCAGPSFIIFALLRLRLITVPRGVSMTANALLFISSAVNPFLYGAMNTRMRAEFVRILKCGRNGHVVIIPGPAQQHIALEGGVRLNIR